MLSPRALVLSFVLFAPAFAAHAQAPRPTLTLETAQTIVARCLAHAEENDLGIAIAVLNDAGKLIAFAKMDDASFAAADIALWKGKSAATYGYSTKQTSEWGVSFAPEHATWEGGLPLFTEDGVLIGGVGVSGAPSAADSACGQAGADVVSLKTKRE